MPLGTPIAKYLINLESTCYKPSPYPNRRICVASRRQFFFDLHHKVKVNARAEQLFEILRASPGRCA